MRFLLFTSCILISTQTLMSVDSGHSEIVAHAAWSFQFRVKWPDTLVSSFRLSGPFRYTLTIVAAMQAFEKLVPSHQI